MSTEQGEDGMEVRPEVADVSEPMVDEGATVICPKCQARNTPDRAKCEQCGAQLLPGRTFGERLLYLIAGMVGAALFWGLAWLFGRMEMTENLPPCCASPGYLALGSLVSLVGGIVLAFGRTPQYERYVKRAQRHAQDLPTQALADLSRALELAPEKERPDILRQRGDLYANLGRKEDALTDLSAFAASPSANIGAKAASKIMGVELEDAVKPFSSTELTIQGLRRELMQEGALKAVGYCKACQDAVEVDEKGRCCRCGATIKEPTFVKPQAGDAEILKLQAAASSARRRRRVWMGIGGASLFACALCVGLGVWSSRNREEVTQATTPAVTAPPGVFAENVFWFQYPADWNRITQKGINTLLNTSLKGLKPESYDYIGGVYTGGVGECEDCAQIVVVVARYPDLTGTLTDAQYEQVKDATEEQMGSRLLSHRKIEVGSLPGAESIYIGPSQQSKIWDLIIVPPEPGKAYLFSCSCPKDTCDAFQATFERAVGTLRIEGPSPPVPTATTAILPTRTSRPSPTPTHLPTDTPTPQPTPSHQPDGTVTAEALNLRAGPGTGYGKVELLHRGDEVAILARTAAGDWLEVAAPDDTKGWVFATYVELNIPLDSIPVATEIPPTPTPSGPTPTPLPPVDAEIERISRGEHGELGQPSKVGPVAAGGEAEVTIVNDTPYELTMLVGAPSSVSVTLEACPACKVYSVVGPVFCPEEGRPKKTVRLKAGTSKVAAKVSDPSVIPFSGSWELVADTSYFNCFFIVTKLQ